MDRLAGKVCLITGAGSGIGQASARLFGQEGASVIVVDVDEAAAEATAAGIREAGGQALAARADVTDAAQTVALADEMVQRLGRIDVLFNNAGISGVGDVLETEPALFERVMRVNVEGVYLMSRAVVPHMIKAGTGSIINMSSGLAVLGVARRVSYAASKGAVLAMTRSMQVDLAPHGIRVNALMPGTILTPFVERYLRDSYADPTAGYDDIRKRQLSSELGKPEDVAYAALYLASDESRFVMASGLVIDGGMTGTKGG
jgi:NAD(P)-dependent dehydrogenase (short-subunit alcohol dehydrogenase family)